MKLEKGILNINCEQCIHNEICHIKAVHLQLGTLALVKEAESCRHYIHECQMERMRETINNQRRQLQQFNEDRQANIGKAYLEWQRDMKDYITMHLVAKLQDLLE